MSTDRGAAYTGGWSSIEADDTPDRECRNCGARVSARFARVYGDNQNKVHRCQDCTDVMADLKYLANGRERPHMVDGANRERFGGDGDE